MVADLGRPDRHRAVGIGAAVEHRDVVEGRAGAQNAQHVLTPVGGGFHQAHLPAHDEIEAEAGFALGEDVLAGRCLARAYCARELAQCGRVEPSEIRDLAQEIGRPRRSAIGLVIVLTGVRHGVRHPFSRSVT
jgi:hypothetical protein